VVIDVNQLILGDCLDVLKTLEPESVDLIYLDPPFFSNRNYEVIWGDQGEIRSFQDRWSGGIDHYIAWLKERVQEMHRVLKPTGSIFLHCDYHANAEIKVFILNKIFDEQNFRCEIIWQRHNAHNDAKKKLAVLSDTIWCYSKSATFTYQPIYVEHDPNYIQKFYKYNDDKGYFRLSDLANPSKVNKNCLYEYKGYQPPTNGWRCSLETMQQWDDAGLIYFPENKTQRLCFKRYLEDNKGALLGNVWTDIQNVQAQSKERIGYPTQKPEALLERIIQCASNEGDIVLDPFLGGGTTIAVADRLKRHWIGIDQSVAAIKVSELRLNKQRDLFSTPFTVQLHKYDYDTLRYSNALEFETWIIQQYGGTANIKQRGDLGIDGRNKDGIPIQVKRSDNIGRNIIDNFKAACERYDKNLYDANKQANKPIGIIIAFSFGKGAIQEVARLKNEENIIIQLVTVDNIIAIAKKPTIAVTFTELSVNDKQLHEIEFTATATSDSGIEFFSWDWNYNANEGFKPEILRDKDGKQTQKFKAGSHCIAVIVIDNDGLENIAVLNFKINGLITIDK
jgi:DNA modification methylase